MYRFMGQWGCRLDADTGLVYCRARWLDPGVKRFIGRDRLDGRNSYVYAHNAPSSLIDVDGLKPTLPLDRYPDAYPGGKGRPIPTSEALTWVSIMTGLIGGSLWMQAFRLNPALTVIITGESAAAGTGYIGPSPICPITQSRSIYNSAQMAEIRIAQTASQALETEVNGVTILYQPGLPADVSAMTLFGENGFILGARAFSSEEELAKTLLHESYRLASSTSAAAGVSSQLASSETEAAFQYAQAFYHWVLGGNR